ncbi:MAG: 16S rRNA (adenine(1518)-N(6)/adenine(1519)-N(6))-dimethyltransferase, partial [Deltaproteobacteria bacterium]
SLEVIEGDFLEVDLSRLFSRYGRLKAVGNLPYGVSTEILFKLLQAHQYLKDITLMFQWEVAQRIVSPPGRKQYGALSVTVRLFSEPELLFRVPRGAFWPKPEVQGGVVHFRLHEQPKGDIETMRGLLEGLFSARRKTILNALFRAGHGPRERIRSLLKRAGIDPMRRPETLSLEEYLILAETLKEA